MSDLRGFCHHCRFSSANFMQKRAFRDKMIIRLRGDGEEKNRKEKQIQGSWKLTVKVLWQQHVYFVHLCFCFLKEGNIEEILSC